MPGLVPLGHLQETCTFFVRHCEGQKTCMFFCLSLYEGQKTCMFFDPHQNIIKCHKQMQCKKYCTKICTFIGKIQDVTATAKLSTPHRQKNHFLRWYYNNVMDHYHFSTVLIISHLSNLFVMIDKKHACFLSLILTDKKPPCFLGVTKRDKSWHDMCVARVENHNENHLHMPCLDQHIHICTHVVCESDYGQKCKTVCAVSIDIFDN